jgi:hypothetical protein
MAAVTFPLEGAVASLYNISSNATQLLKMIYTADGTSTGSCIPYDINIAVTTPSLNITSQGATSRAMRAGLKSWVATIKTRYPRTNKVIGSTGLISLDNGSNNRSFVKSYNLSIRANAMDISQLNNPVNSRIWRYFRPSSLIEWDGSFTCAVDAANAVTMTESADTVLASYSTLKMTLFDDGAADPYLSGSVMLSQLGHAIPIGESALQMLSYQFVGTGSLGYTGGTNTNAIFGVSGASGTVATPEWDMTSNDGTPDVQLTFGLDSTPTRQYVGMAFWTGINVNSSVDGLIGVDYTFQGTGPLTPA